MVIGGPTLYVGGFLALVGIVIGAGGLDPSAFDPKALWLLLWALGGLLGMLSWLRLSFAFVIHGKTGLADCAGVWWLGLLLGIGTACLMLALFMAYVADWNRSLDRVLQALATGPALILPALWLLWLRR